MWLEANIKDFEDESLTASIHALKDRLKEHGLACSSKASLGWSILIFNTWQNAVKKSRNSKKSGISETEVFFFFGFFPVRA